MKKQCSFWFLLVHCDFYPSKDIISIFHRITALLLVVVVLVVVVVVFVVVVVVESKQ